MSENKSPQNLSELYALAGKQIELTTVEKVVESVGREHLISEDPVAYSHPDMSFEVELEQDGEYVSVNTAEPIDAVAEKFEPVKEEVVQEETKDLKCKSERESNSIIYREIEIGLHKEDYAEVIDELQELRSKADSLKSKKSDLTKEITRTEDKITEKIEEAADGRYKKTVECNVYFDKPFQGKKTISNTTHNYTEIEDMTDEDEKSLQCKLDLKDQEEEKQPEEQSPQVENATDIQSKENSENKPDYTIPQNTDEEAA